MSNKKLSNPNKGWKWVTTSEGNYLQAESLNQSGFKHGFFTKEWGTKNPKDLIKILDVSKSFHWVKQVHGSYVIDASKTSFSQHPEADGLVSDKAMQSLWIYSADCIPILIADPRTNIIAACHAGWRGIAKGTYYY